MVHFICLLLDELVGLKVLSFLHLLYVQYTRGCYIYNMLQKYYFMYVKQSIHGIIYANLFLFYIFLYVCVNVVPLQAM